MKDRQPTQVLSNGAIRYGIYNADGTLDHYEYMKREDAPTVEGTPLNKANLLSDATAKKVWPAGNAPDDPTVNDAFGKLANGTARVGDISITARPAPSANWLPCDGRAISEADYPELFSVLRTSVTQDNWATEVVDSSTPLGDATTRSGNDVISRANGIWFRGRTMCNASNDAIAHLWYSDDNMETWKTASLPSATTGLGPIHWYEQKYVCYSTWYGIVNGAYALDAYLLYADSPGGPWKRGQRIASYSSSMPEYSFTYDIISDGSTYYIFGKSLHQYDGSGAFYTRNLFGTWSSQSYSTVAGQNPRYVKNVVYNPENGYFYAAVTKEINTSILKLARTKTPLDIDSWQYIYQHGQDGNFNPICTEGNFVIGFGYNSSQKNYAYSTDGGTTMHTGVAPYNVYRAICQDGIIVAWGHKDATETTSATPVIMITDDITQGFKVVETDVSVSNLSGNDAGLIVGACTSGSSSTRNILQDFSHANKKIPNITPDSRSHAYIKAAEE